LISVVGIGLEGIGSASPRGRRLLAQASVVVGTDRHLALAGESSAQRLCWDGSPDSLEPLLAAHASDRTVLLASGDPNLFGIGSSLIERLGPDAVDVEPSVSSLQLALARARVPGAGTALLSAHGRPLAAAAGLAASSRRAAILTDPRHDPAALAAALLELGVEENARLVVCERLGSPSERVRESSLGHCPPGPFDPLAVVVLDRRSGPGPGLGRPEAAYEHSGQITKSEVRSISLAALDPGPDDVVWDVGAGSGSVAIEAARLACRGAVYAIERRPDRAQQARGNSARSWNVEVLVGEAVELLPRLPTPDAIFLGGGGDQIGALLQICLTRLGERSSPLPGRLVANLATLDSVVEAVAVLRLAGLSWNLSQVSVARARELAGRLNWEAQNPVHVLAVRMPR